MIARWINHLRIRQLRKTEALLLQRIDKGVEAADLGLAEWESHAQKMRERLAEIRQRIANLEDR